MGGVVMGGGGNDQTPLGVCGESNEINGEKNCFVFNH